jgi:hypothetical protein
VDGRDRVIALGPVGLVGLVLVLLGLLRRRPLVALAGAAAVTADLAVPVLGGYAARNAPGLSDPWKDAPPS